MRKIIVSNLVSLDGFMAGPDGNIEWFVNITDKEFEDYAVNLMNSVDTMLFGRVTYQLMESYWPIATEDKEDPRIIDAMNNFPKIVFSKTLADVSWKNSKLIEGNLVEEILKLKQQPGKDIVVYGSGSIVSILTQEGLIDDYRIFIVPVILGSGKSQFENLKKRKNLKLLDTRTFKSGLILLHYQYIND